jgi:hypothetical protein
MRTPVRLNQWSKVATIVAIVALQSSLADRALAWGAGGGGGPQPPKDSEPYKPKKLTDRDRARMEKVVSKLWEEEYGGRKPTPTEIKQGQALIDDLDKKGYDTDPEYEKMLRQIKLGLSGGDIRSGAAPPPSNNIFIPPSQGVTP